MLQHATEKINDRDCIHYQVTAGLIFKENKLLITQRLADDKFGDLWEFPGGKQQAGESLSECLNREIREELNINIEINEHLFKIDHDYDKFKITLHVFLCHLNGGEPERREVQDWKWIDLSEIKNYEFTAADQSVIRKFPAYMDKF